MTRKLKFIKFVRHKIIKIRIFSSVKGCPRALNLRVVLKYSEEDRFPLLLKEGWTGHLIISVLQCPFPDRGGWFISFIIYSYQWKEKPYSIEKALNHSDHLSVAVLFGWSKPINHPGRIKPLQYYGDLCIAATPPSKGGETFTRELNFDIQSHLS